MSSKGREYSIEVPGVPDELQSLARNDIGLLIDLIAQASDALGMQFLLRKVCVTDWFQHEVNQLLNESLGIGGYVAVRNNAHAIAKTLWTRDQQGDIIYVVIIDAQQIGSWGLNNPRCLTTVLHELIHVFYEGRHLDRLGEKEYTSNAFTRERLLDGWAGLLLDEFDVDCLVDTLVGRLAKKDDGRPWSLRELEEAQGIDWVRSLLDVLSRIPQLIEEKVWKFQTRRIGIDGITITVLPDIKDILILVSHIAAMYMKTDLWPDIYERIKETEASTRFFKEHLDAILASLDDAELPFEESVQNVAHAVEGILHNFGLGLKTVPEGVYISVETPSR